MQLSGTRQVQTVGLLMIIVVFVIGVCSWVILGRRPTSHTHQQIRQFVEKVSTVKELQNWAVDLLNNKSDSIPNNLTGWFPGSDMNSLPSFVRKLNPRMVLVSGLHTPKAHVLIYWRDKQGSYGLIIGATNFTASSVKVPGVTYDARAWKPGVYTWVQK